MISTEQVHSGGQPVEIRKKNAKGVQNLQPRVARGQRATLGNQRKSFRNPDRVAGIVYLTSWQPLQGWRALLGLFPRVARLTRANPGLKVNERLRRSHPHSNHGDGQL